jgi:TetR/AcrR family transcriptional regulator, transcriptional repressor for nem operon
VIFVSVSMSPATPIYALGDPPARHSVLPLEEFEGLGNELLVRGYLSPEHRDNPEEGCPSAALLDEITRCTDPTKQAYTNNVLAFIDDLAARLAPHDPPSACTRTLSVYAMMIGTLQLFRALADRQLADDILEQGIRNALVLLDVTQQD